MTHMPAFSVRSVRAFAHEHDNLPAFHAAYLVLTFLAAAMFNLGFFAFVILAHMCLDVFKYREVHGLNWKRTLEGVIRESVVDITLLMFGVVVSVYLNPAVTGLSGIKGMMLAEITVLRSIGIMAPKLKILFEALKILADIDHYLGRMHPKFGKKISVIEYVCAFSICLSVCMLAFAPALLGVSVQEYLRVLVGELTPWHL